MRNDTEYKVEEVIYTKEFDKRVLFDRHSLHFVFVPCGKLKFIDWFKCLTLLAWLSTIYSIVNFSFRYIISVLPDSPGRCRGKKCWFIDCRRFMNKVTNRPTRLLCTIRHGCYAERGAYEYPADGADGLDSAFDDNGKPYPMDNSCCECCCCKCCCCECHDDCCCCCWEEDGSTHSAGLPEQADGGSSVVPPETTSSNRRDVHQRERTLSESTPILKASGMPVI